MLSIEFIGDKDTLQKVSLSKSLKLSVEFTGLSAKLSDELSMWVEQYFNGTPVSYQAPEGSLFQNKVWEALVQIPFGTTCSYQKLAAQIGSPKAARAVGNACGQNPWPLLVPCHRVVRTDKSLGGFAFPIEVKQELLEFERERRFSLKQ